MKASRAMEKVKIGENIANLSRTVIISLVFKFFIHLCKNLNILYPMYCQTQGYGHNQDCPQFVYQPQVQRSLGDHPF